MESYPHEAAERADDGSWRVVLAISEPAWLERLLLSLGPAAKVTHPPDATTVAAAAAHRLLTRYVA